jgi:dihydrofolate reductase
MIRLIAAMDTRRGIAIDTGLPWHLPGDSAYFRQQTSSGLILMGRATYNEFAAPLHDRENYVLTTSAAPLRDGFRPVRSLDELLGTHPGTDVWVVGGAFVYAETLGEADELVVTQVAGDFHCTKFFPPFEDRFALESEGDEQSDGGVTYRFETWGRRQAPLAARPS